MSVWLREPRDYDVLHHYQRDLTLQLTNGMMRFKHYSEMSIYTGDNDAETTDSEDEWATRNQGGEELDQSLFVLDNSARDDGNQGGEKEKGRNRRGGGLQADQINDMMKIAVEGMMKAQAAGAQVNNEQLGELTRLMAQREKRELEQKEQQDAEREKRKREKAEGPVVTEDPVKIIEQELMIRDDSNRVIDIKARSLLGR